jgi:hypothetical protein
VYIVHDHVHAAQVVGGFIPDRKSTYILLLWLRAAKNLNHIVGRNTLLVCLAYGYQLCQDTTDLLWRIKRLRHWQTDLLNIRKHRDITIGF